jgi:DNA-binding CsgD family transcriptional regulator
LHFAVERAIDMTVLGAQGVESESEFAFSGLSEILRPLASELDRLPEVQADALRSVLAYAPANTGGLAVGAATLGALAAAAERGPVLVVVDDFQWLDAASTQALLFATRRLGAEGVAVLLAARAGEQTTDLLSARLPTLELGGLARAPAIALLARSTVRPIADSVAEQLVASTEGNPLALLELPSLLSDAQLAGAQPLGRPLPAGVTIRRAFERRLHALPGSTQALLVVAAASHSGSFTSIVDAGQLLGLPAGVLEPAETAGVVQVDQGRVSFQHPLLRSVAYHLGGAARRRRAHGALAAALRGEMTEEERTWHLAEATLTPDEGVALRLEQLAKMSGERGAYTAAASAFEQAARLSPRPGDRARRLLEAAGHAQFLGRLEHSLTLLDEARSCTEEAADLAEIQRLRAIVAIWTGSPAEATRLWLEAVGQIEGTDPERASLMLAESAMALTMTANVPQVVEAATLARAMSERAGGAVDVGVTATYGHALILAGRAAEAMPLLERCERAFSESNGLSSVPTFTQSMGHARVWIEQYEQARRALDQAVAAARDASAAALLPFPLTCLAELELRTGKWIGAYANASEALQIAEGTGQVNAQCFSLAILATIEAGLGHEQRCREHARRALDGASALGIDNIRIYVAHALGLLELGLGQPHLAVEQLAPAGRLSRGLGCQEPGVIWWAADLVEAHTRGGQLSDARRELRQLEQEAEQTGRVWAAASSARCRGLLADEDRFASHFEEALSAHAELHAPFEHARTELCYGERLRRARRLTEARTHLRAALDVFDRLDAGPWARQVRDELRAAEDHSPAKNRTGPARLLTAKELQVARTVAHGATNREAAAALFLSTRTIEFHLSNIYRKLGLRSRSELVRALLDVTAC